MKTTLFTFLSALLLGTVAQAQTTAMDFNRTDCNGNQHHLFAELDSNHVAILEFFMLNCGSCITAGNKIKALKNSLDTEFPGKIHSYSIGYHNSYNCADISNWVSTNNFNTVPMDSGATQVAYYGGFGMPTVVVVAGTGHDVLFSTIGFTTSDTTTMGTEIRNFFQSLNTGVTKVDSDFSVQVFPNPAQGSINVQIEMPKNTDVSLRLINLNGQVLRQYETQVSGSTQQQLDIQGIPSGVYVLQTNADGHFNQQRVLILE